VTIATNMAGRGTDILLGGNAEHMARQQAIAEGVAEKLAKGEEKFVDDDEFVYFFLIDSFYRLSRADWERIFGHFPGSAPRTTRRSSPAAASTSSAPSATSHGASTTSFAAAPDARATPARRASTCRSRTT